MNFKKSLCFSILFGCIIDDIDTLITAFANSPHPRINELFNHLLNLEMLEYVYLCLIIIFSLILGYFIKTDLVCKLIKMKKKENIKFVKLLCWFANSLIIFIVVLVTLIIINPKI